METTTTGIRVLNSEQLSQFDTDLMTPRMWAVLERWLQSEGFTDDRALDVLDVGGGNGAFADQFLAKYGQARVTVLDNSAMLLGRNAPNGRKSLVHLSAEELHDSIGRFDLIFFKWVLHHFVVNGYWPTRRMQVSVLRQARSLLKEGGRIIVLECLPRGFVSDGFSTWLVNAVTSSRLIAPFVRSMGANTAGTGLCFLGRRQWEDSFRASGFSVESFVDLGAWKDRSVGMFDLKLWALGLRSISNGYFFIAPIDLRQPATGRAHVGTGR